MNKYLWLLILAPLFSFAEDELDCDNVYTTIDINYCITQEADQAFSELENYLDKAKERYASQKTITDTLNKSQETWLAYRAAHCDAVYEQWSGGTIRGAVFGSCMLKLNKQRTHLIWQDYLTYVDSTEPLLPEPQL